MRAAVSVVDDEFLDAAEAEELSDGTTAVVAALWSQSLLVANIGDSKAILCRSQQVRWFSGRSVPEGA